MHREGTMERTQETNKISHERIFLFALLGLLILRIPYVGGLEFFNVQWKWLETVFEISTYLLTTFLVWWELEDLAEYHMDVMAVVIIMIFKPVETLVMALQGGNQYDLAFPTAPSLLIWLIAIVFAIGIWWKRSRLPGVKPIRLSWLLIGILIGLLTAACLSYPRSFEMSVHPEFSYIIYGGPAAIKQAVKDAWKGVPLAFLFQVGYAAVSEEPLFRGFLWGYLRKLKWHELWIWLFQTGLFMLGHIYYLHRSLISFWIIVPVGGLVLGLVAWRSRTIASSMMAHGVVNAAARAFDYLLALYRLG